jgi:hypothetical protein
MAEEFQMNKTRRRMSARVREIVETQIGADWATSNAHGVDLRRALIALHRLRLSRALYETIQHFKACRR